MTGPNAYTRGSALRATNVANDDLPSLEAQIESWDAYVSAQRLAQSTGSVEDGITAGRAWRRWLDLFMTSEQRNFVEGPRGGVIG
ncbi:hypothetical protein FHT29_000400 [Rhizobium sp. SG741]|nr:hypothetical protein [Rhizobium sp. SG741]